VFRCCQTQSFDSPGTRQRDRCSHQGLAGWGWRPAELQQLLLQRDTTLNLCISQILSLRLTLAATSLTNVYFHCIPYWSFYRSMHMHSVDYVVERCAFVCLSVTLQYCVKMAERIIKFSLPGSPIILVFFHTRHHEIPRGSPPLGAPNTDGVWKIWNFQAISRISEMIRDRAR